MDSPPITFTQYRGQLFAIIRYELLMRWRQRILPMLFLLLLGTITFIIASTSAGSSETGANTQTTEETLVLTVFMLFSGLGWAFPLLVADTVSKDRQHHIWPILNSTPLPATLYLAAKVLSVWSVLCVGLLGLLLYAGVEIRLVYGSFDVPMYLGAGLASATTILFYTGLSILMGATQPTRRRAVFIAIGIASLNILMLLTISGTTRDAVIGNPAVFVVHYAAYSTTEMSPYSVADRALTLVSMSAQLALLWFAVDWWLREQYSRA